MFQASSPGPEHPDGGGSCDAEQRVAAQDSASRPTPQPLEPAAAGACSLGQAGALGPFSADLSLQDFLPPGQGAEQPPRTAAVAMLEALQTVDSDLPSSVPSATMGTGPSGPQEYDFRTVLRPAVVPSGSPGPLQTVAARLGCEESQLCRDTHVQPDTRVPGEQVALPNPHSPSTSPRQEESSRAGAQRLGHASEGAVPTAGHASGRARSRPRWNVHGHVSDASVRVGENVWDEVPTRPRWSVHGHVSQSHMLPGLLPGEGQPAEAGPRQHAPDHSSLSGVGLGAQSPARACVPGLPTEPASELASDGSCTQVSGSSHGEDSGPQALPSAVAAPSALGDSITEEPGDWDPKAVLSPVASVGPRGREEGEKRAVPGLGQCCPSTGHWP